MKTHLYRTIHIKVKMGKINEESELEVVNNNEVLLPMYHDTQANQHPDPSTAPPPSDYSIFPRDTVIYRTTYISLSLGPQYEANKPQPPPLFYVSVHMNNRFTNKSPIPQIRLHFGPNDTHPVIGAVNFRVTTTSDITIWHDPKGTGNEASANGVANKGSETKISMTKTGALLSDVHTFYHPVSGVDGTLIRENFEWRHSGEPEVETLAKENHPGENITQEKRGLKLVRVSTGQSLAVFVGGKHQRNYNPRRVAGKLRFVGAQVLDPLVVVLTVLSIVERSRRNAVWNASDIFGCVLL
jgi:hypothetical protein